ncbi:MAG: hypothetical protein AB7T06_48415 [Kofleriaceae bacterium]
MRHVLLVAIVAACGTSGSPSSPIGQQRADTSAAITALQASRFADARREADAVLARDARSSQAAAVRAIATYQGAVQRFVAEMTAIINTGELAKVLDHRAGRAMWTKLLDALDAVDRDLEIVARDPGFSLELCIACLEIDWNGRDGVDDRDRRMLELEYDGRGGELAENDARRRPTFRFDVGDAEWGRAMVGFQRAFVNLVLAYDWRQLDKLFGAPLGDRRLVIPIADKARVVKAHGLFVFALERSAAERTAYLAEIDDDREWVPNPHQKSHPIPLAVDASLYATWDAVLGDVRDVLASKTGVSFKEIGRLLDDDLEAMAPAAFLDIGAMLREPKDIVLDLSHDSDSPEDVERVLRGLVGNGYKESLRASPLVGRLRTMIESVDKGEETLEHKLRYLFWFN